MISYSQSKNDIAKDQFREAQMKINSQNKLFYLILFEVLVFICAKGDRQQALFSHHSSSHVHVQVER